MKSLYQQANCSRYWLHAQWRIEDRAVQLECRLCSL